MKRAASRLLLLLALLLLAPPAFANECESAGHDAEQADGLPADLLVAIGRIESGRRGADGRVAPWPWSVNAAGQGYYLSSAAEAIGLVRSLQARGIRSIDVGCFQVNLMYHPGAFASLEAAFDPGINARAAGAFLRDLRGIATGWEDAVGRYHSADPSLGIPYMRQVVASWHGGASMPAPPMSQVAALVRVIVPQAYAAAAMPNATASITDYAAAAPRVMRPTALRSGGLRLPVVITPSASRL
ncbi:lytic transglycosylase domain-containing protein [Acidisphaera sp. L21]|uniref:lytic transglycosylase domain-containing protein n=1 Tax=Acidisphaera sp. L21 TaxID=1641851 RepID=UPI00131DF65D|nr:lytic transglycosylase domain-containing protein [Acidisphaera sp. L21]